MDDLFYNTLLRAIECVESIGVSQEDRIGATRYLQEALARPDLMNYLHYILTSAHSVSVQFMSLKLLEDWLLSWWNKVGLDEQQGMRTGVLSLVHDHPGLYVESRPMRAKLGKILAQMAQRHYPNAWAGCLRDLVAIGTDSPPSSSSSSSSSSLSARQEISILALRYFFEDVMDTDFASALPLQRKEEIILGLQTETDPLLGHTFSLLCGLAESAVTTAADAVVRSSSSSLAADVLLMLTPLVRLVKPDALCLPERSFLIITLQFLPHDTLREAALLFLRELCGGGDGGGGAGGGGSSSGKAGGGSSQRMSRDLLVAAVAVIPPAMGALLSDIVSVSTAPNPARFPAVAGEALLSLLVTHLPMVDSGYLGDASRVAALEIYLQLLCQVMTHAGPRLALTMVKGWCKILKLDVTHASNHQDLLQVLSHSSGVVSTLLPLVLERIAIRARCDENGPLLGSLITAADADEFDNKADYDAYYSELRSAVRLLGTHAASKSPAGAATVLRSRVAELVSHSSHWTSEQAYRCDAFLAIAPGIVTGLLDDGDVQGDTDGPAWGMVVEALELALHWAPIDGSLIEASTRLLLTISPVLARMACRDGVYHARVHGWLVDLFTRLFERIGYTGQAAAAHSDPASVRKGATSAVSELSSTLGPALAKGGFTALVDQVCRR